MVGRRAEANCKAENIRKLDRNVRKAEMRTILLQGIKSEYNQTNTLASYVKRKENGNETNG